MARVAIPEAGLTAFISAVEDGSIGLTFVTFGPGYDRPQDCAGVLSYEASNGWRVSVFSDCGAFDNLERIEAPDGRYIEFPEFDNIPAMRGYQPVDEAAWLRYGLPGYLKTR